MKEVRVSRRITVDLARAGRRRGAKRRPFCPVNAALSANAALGSDMTAIAGTPAMRRCETVFESGVGGGGLEGARLERPPVIGVKGLGGSWCMCKSPEVMLRVHLESGCWEAAAFLPG